MKMIKQEVIKAISQSKCIKKSQSIIEKYSKEGYELTDSSFSRSPMWMIYTLTFNKKD